MTLNSLLRLGAVSLVAAVFPGAGLAQYPERPVHMVVPYPPGGGTDNIARLLADRLAQQMGRPFVVDNRPGANGNIGADAVARAPADGYTLLLAGMGPLAVNPGLYKRMPYDPAKAFAPIAVVSSAPLVLVAGPSAPAGDLRQFVRIMRERPDSLTIANAGEGSPHHICAGLFVKAAGASVIHVPYKGAAPAVTDLLGGSVQALCENVGTISPYLKERKLRPLAVSTQRRTALLPDVPTFEEGGLPGIDFSLWFMLVAPAGTPSEVVARLNREVNAVLAQPDAIARLRDLANEPVGGTVQAAADFLRKETERWPGLVKSIGLNQQ
ncbi:Bug family tripartite tricarboxylate transporter substrate binding protein [Pigmentiphaga kullae]|uniref:Tripartite-type tricarboxylate transporter receptor subunit TctC n=1 Tax=Pigmentiphaga kullae TaxID=151784 RepID=A0A4Q7N6G2_9BURK|nr:tripartite tricarboxylate transporter substrate binding protein [Pigmentiphaga kullae]RZS76917.1 tripartite-type tricarboxylate transporter receptor subunit TctC [Pigmentiphaga kullae]